MNKPEYALVPYYACECALIMVNMLDYALVYLNKQSSEYAIMLNVSDPVHSINKITVQIT